MKKSTSLFTALIILAFFNQSALALDTWKSMISCKVKEGFRDKFENFPTVLNDTNFSIYQYSNDEELAGQFLALDKSKSRPLGSIQIFFLQWKSLGSGNLVLEFWNDRYRSDETRIFNLVLKPTKGNKYSGEMLYRKPYSDTPNFEVLSEKLTCELTDNSKKSNREL